MAIQKTVALLAVPTGLLFWFLDPSYLLSVITRTGLDWHGVFLPLALGIIFGCLAGMLKLDKIQRLHPVVVWISTGLFTCGIVGAAAIYLSHQYWFLTQPSLWLASLGLGLHVFFIAQLKFSSRYKRTGK